MNGGLSLDMIKYEIASVLALAVFLNLALLAALSAQAWWAQPTTAYPCTEAGLDTALANGGSAAFTCATATTIIVGGTKNVSKSVNLDGGGRLTLSGGNIRSILNITASITVGLANLTLRDGKASSLGGAVFNNGILSVSNSTFLSNTASSGGAIYNDFLGSVTIQRSAFQSNTANVGGVIYNVNGLTITSTSFRYNMGLSEAGAINNVGRVSVADSVFVSNTSHNGGAISNDGDMEIETSSFDDNTAPEAVMNGGIGGAILNNDSLVVTASTFSNNGVKGAGVGGAIDNAGALTVTNSTFAGNIAEPGSSGGAINNNVGSLFLLNSTLANNSAPTDGFGIGGGGGVYNNGGSATLMNTIVALNSPDNCRNPVSSVGHNLSSDSSCTLMANGDISNTDPLLGPLQNNGGPTFTRALIPRSPAIDKADNVGCPSTDQRGARRPVDGDGNGSAICDIGAYEVQRSVYLPLVVR